MPKEGSKGKTGTLFLGRGCAVGGQSRWDLLTVVAGGGKRGRWRKSGGGFPPPPPWGGLRKRWTSRERKRLYGKMSRGERKRGDFPSLLKKTFSYPFGHRPDSSWSISSEPRRKGNF